MKRTNILCSCLRFNSVHKIFSLHAFRQEERTQGINFPVYCMRAQIRNSPRLQIKYTEERLLLYNVYWHALTAFKTRCSASPISQEHVPQLSQHSVGSFCYCLLSHKSQITLRYTEQNLVPFFSNQAFQQDVMGPPLLSCCCKSRITSFKSLYNLISHQCKELMEALSLPHSNRCN